MAMAATPAPALAEARDATRLGPLVFKFILFYFYTSNVTVYLG